MNPACIATRKKVKCFSFHKETTMTTHEEIVARFRQLREGLAEMRGYL